MSDARDNGKGVLPRLKLPRFKSPRLKQAAAVLISAGTLAATGSLTTGAAASPVTARPVTASPAARAPSVVVCAGWASCDARGDSSHGYEAHDNASFWHMFAGNNCTNYAAYAESTAFGVAEPSYLLGNAGQWAAAAAAHGVPVNSVPAVGAVAEWAGGAPGMGPDGHVAVVEQVGPDDRYIVVSQQAISSDRDGYDWTRINAGSPAGDWQEWPDHFIHFAGRRVAGPARTAVGYYDPLDHSYRLQKTLGQDTAAITARHGQAADIVPLAGNWTGRGAGSIGWYVRHEGRFFVRDQIRGGRAARSFTFGPPGMVPLAGNWDGRGGAGVGYYDPATGTFHLRNELSSGPASVVFRFGPPHMIPLAGDWNGSGHAGVGYYDPATGWFYLRGKLSAGPARRAFRFGPAGMVPLAGNWSGGRSSGVGFYNPADGWFHLRDRLSAGPASTRFKFGPGGMVPLAGNWTGRLG